jgi:hypothetical protein
MTALPIRVISTQDRDLLQVRFFPTDICNFQCSYCFLDSGNINKYRYPKNINTIIKNFRILFDQYSKKLNKTRFHLVIIGGGEPTLWPHVTQFCKELKEKHNVYITICSNGSRSLRWWNKNSMYVDDVILSCHNEEVDIDHYIRVGDFLFSSGIKVTGSMLMDPKNWNKCISFIERMKESRYPWFIEAKAVVDPFTGDIDSYTNDQLAYLKVGIKRLPNSEWILKRLNDVRIHESIILFNDGSAVPAKPHDIIVNKWNNFQGWNCNVAIETLLIKTDGFIIGSCQEPIFIDKKFNIFSETFDQDFSLDVGVRSIICPRNNCSCQPDTHVTKQAQI